MTQTGRTKHIRSKHRDKKNDLQIRTRISLSVSLEIPPAIDLDHHWQPEELDADINMSVSSELPPARAIDLDHQDSDVDINMSDDVPSSPLPFQPLAEVEVHHDQADQAFASTNYHPFINGMT